MDAEDDRLTLTAGDREALTRLTQGSRPHSDRAKAILALAERNDVDYAAERSGLTYRQVRYWYIRFRAGGLQAMLPPSPVPSQAETLEPDGGVRGEAEVIEDSTEPEVPPPAAEAVPEPGPGRKPGGKARKKADKKSGKKAKKKADKKAKKAKKKADKSGDKAGRPGNKAGGLQKKAKKKSGKKSGKKSAKKNGKSGKKPRKKPAKKSGKGAKPRKKR